MQLSFSMLAIPTRSLRAMFLLFIIFYLSFHAVSGERGIIAWFKAKHRLAAIEIELKETRLKTKKLSERASLLSGPTIDHDMLDEQARKVLGFARPNEVVILNAAEE